MSNITTAMVMAAGHGTRMRPLTDNTCKALVEVGGKPLIDHMLDRLCDAGITRAVVNVHAFADKLEAHLRGRETGPEIIISDEREELLETGGGLVKALPLLGDAPILICNIDAVWMEFAPVLSGLLSSWAPETMDELLLLAPKTDVLGYAGAGDFDLVKRNRIARRSGHSAGYVFAGVQVFKPELAATFKAEKFSRNLIWNETLKQQRAFGHILPGYWMHVGDPHALKAAEAVLEEQA